MHSEREGKVLEDVVQGPMELLAINFTRLCRRPPQCRTVSFSKGVRTAAISGASNEPATNTGLDMSSKDSTKSTRPVQSSSDESSYAGFLLLALIIHFPLCIFIYVKGRKHGANKLSAQLPDYEFFKDREALRKEQKELKSKDDMSSWPYDPQELRKELAEKVEKLDRKELKHLRRRAKVIESRLERQSVPVETVNAREGPHKAVDAGVLPDKTHPRKGHQISRTLPHENDAKTRAKPDTETTGPLITKPGPGPEFNLVLESLSAENDAAKDKLGRIRLAKEVLKSREKELEAQVKDRKKRIQEFHAPKSEGSSSFASSMLLGSALTIGVTIGVTMIMSSLGN